MWRQNVASAASGGQAASPGGLKPWFHLPTRGVRGPSVKMWRQAAGWHRCMELHQGSRQSPGVTGCGVRTWRCLLTCRQRATWRRRTWRQNVASSAIDLRGVNTWRQEAQAFRQVSSKRVFSRWAICAPPQPTPLLFGQRATYVVADMQTRSPEQRFEDEVEC